MTATTLPGTEPYTPHGYLHLSGHCKVLRPLGVLRSCQEEPTGGVGFAWHFPNYAGGYGHRHEHHRAALTLNFGEGESGGATHCDLHTCHVKRFVVPGGRRATFWPGQSERGQSGGGALHARAEVGGPQTVTVHFSLRRRLSPGGEWGESGLIARRMGEDWILQVFEDGPAFALRGAGQAREVRASSPAAITDLGGCWTVTGRRGEELELALHLELPGAPGVGVDLTLAPGRSAADALANVEEHHRQGAEQLSSHLRADAEFEAQAPRLTGGWPAHWRRGLHYDLQTLRMMPRAPVGGYAHLWDAMQLHAPRVVLAEAAMDSLALGHADPELAQRLLLGTFQDALAPNVPCSREDGSVNMVAADGTVCGTGPQWGYPLLCAQRLYRLRPDPAWLAELYPHLGRYLEFWGSERRSPLGHLHFACSWESGQDDSPRFGPQPLGGGHPVRHLMPVDLYAAMAHGAEVLAEFADELGLDREAGRWRELGEGYRRDLATLFTGTRFADREGLDGPFTAVQDAMLAAPFALGVAGEETLAAGPAQLAALAPQGEVWPVPFWTQLEAALALGDQGLAGTLVGAVADRVYRFWDARDPAPGQTLPGISAEYWPPDGRCGGEGYGWGAFLVHLLLHDLIGVQPSARGLTLRPCFPPALRGGGVYGAELTLHGRRLALDLLPTASGWTARLGDQQATRRWGESWTPGEPGPERSRP